MKYFQILLYLLTLIISTCLQGINKPDTPIIIEICLSLILTALYLFVSDLIDFNLYKKIPKFIQQFSFEIFGLLWILIILKTPAMIYYIPLFFLFKQWNIQQALPYYLLVFISLLIVTNHYNAIIIIALSIITNAFYNYYQLNQKALADNLQTIDQLTEVNERINSELSQFAILHNQQQHQSILEERKRITDEIHDILGHQLSSAIIQMSALELTTDDPNVQDKLHQIQSILNTSMTNVRKVIHAQRNSAINLQNELEYIVDNFNQCPVELIYDIHTNMPSYVQYSIIQIVKEAFTNINKHSDANQVIVKLIEINELWSLLIYDNGTKTNINIKTSGIGLLSMEERVKQLDGSLVINQENGFRIYIKIPIKGE